MKSDTSSAIAKQIMLEFADLTGLAAGGKAPRRYLWTDAFAVCNFLELYRQTQDKSWRDLALRLIDQVHHVLGRHRPGASQSGWISGLGEKEGELHPTRGGLRIGKRLNERRPDEPPDERLEWDQDGQYFHYLTKWMHALRCASRVTGDATHLRRAIELAQAAHSGFSYAPVRGGTKRMYWKMSIDLSRPLVPSMGQHDPLDGLVTCCELQSAVRGFGTAAFPDLDAEIADFAAMCRGKEWATDDALGIGGLLCDSFRIAQMVIKGSFPLSNLLQEVADAALPGLQAVAETNLLEFAARYRLPFRELGLSIGLKGVERLSGLVENHPESFAEKLPSLQARLGSLTKYLPLGEKIETFWLQGTNKDSGTWKEHREINIVMLATSLAPDEFLKAD